MRPFVLRLGILLFGIQAMSTGQHPETRSRGKRTHSSDGLATKPCRASGSGKASTATGTLTSTKHVQGTLNGAGQLTGRPPSQPLTSPSAATDGPEPMMSIVSPEVNVIVNLTTGHRTIDWTTMVAPSAATLQVVQQYTDICVGTLLDLQSTAPVDAAAAPNSAPLPVLPVAGLTESEMSAHTLAAHTANDGLENPEIPTTLSPGGMVDGATLTDFLREAARRSGTWRRNVYYLDPLHFDIGNAGASSKSPGCNNFDRCVARSFGLPRAAQRHIIGGDPEQAPTSTGATTIVAAVNTSCHWITFVFSQAASSISVYDSLPGHMSNSALHRLLTRFRTVLNTLGKAHLLDLDPEAGTDATIEHAVSPKQCTGNTTAEGEPLYNGCGLHHVGVTLTAAYLGGAPALGEVDVPAFERQLRLQLATHLAGLPALPRSPAIQTWCEAGILKIHQEATAHEPSPSPAWAPTPGSAVLFFNTARKGALRQADFIAYEGPMARVKPTDYKGVRQLSVPAQDVFEFDPELIGQPSPRAPTPLDRTKRAARGHPVATADAEHTRALAEEDGLSAEVSDRLGRAATAQASRGAPQYNVSVTRLRATYHAAAAKAGLDPRDDSAAVYYLQERIDECSTESGLTGASLGIAQRQLSASMMDLKHENPAESAVVKRFVRTYQQGRRPLDTEIAGPACPIPVSDAEEIMHTVEWLRDSAMEQGRLLKALKYNMFVVLFAADLSAGARTADVTRMSSKKTWIRDGTTLCTFHSQNFTVGQQKTISF
jgi:hypothetical protein